MTADVVQARDILLPVDPVTDGTGTGTTEA